MEQTQFNGPDSGLGTVGDTELGEDVLDVGFDRAHTHNQVLGDLAVGLTLGEQLQHFALAWREPPWGQFLWVWRLASPMLEQADHELLVQHRLSMQNALHSSD